MNFGASTFLWTSPFGDDQLRLATHAAELGFDVLEVCVEDPDRLSANALLTTAEESGVEISVCGAFGPDRDVSHEDPLQRRSRIDYLKRCIDLAAAVGSPHVVGPMYSATGKTRLLPDDDRGRQRERAALSLREIADYASDRGVALAIEPLNRFETDLINTVEQGLELCASADRRNLGLLLDTFHLNIEEKDIGSAIRRAGDRLLHFHASENDRGTPGSGHVEWEDVFAALCDVGFDGAIVIESFTPEIREIARAVSLWRPVAESPDRLAADGLAFLRNRLDAARPGFAAERRRASVCGPRQPENPNAGLHGPSLRRRSRAEARALHPDRRRSRAIGGAHRRLNSTRTVRRCRGGSVSIWTLALASAHSDAASIGRHPSAITLLARSPRAVEICSALRARSRRWCR